MSSGLDFTEQGFSETAFGGPHAGGHSLRWFTPRVEVPFRVPAGGDPVRVRVFDVRGREVRRLADGEFPSGEFRISWDGRTSGGHRLAPGTYFVRVEIGRHAFTQKVTMLD